MGRLAGTTKLCKPTKSKSTRAGLVFPVGRILRKLKQANVVRIRRISVGAAVYIAAVLEYMTSELLEISANITKQQRKRLLTPRFLMLSIMNDAEIHETLRSVTIPSSGVVPKMHPALLKVPKSPKHLGNSTPSGSSMRLANSPTHVLATPPVHRRPASAAARATASVGAVVRATPPTVAALQLKVRQLIGGQRLEVVQADITKVKTDAIVHPTGNQYSFSGQVGNSIMRVGGQQLTREMQLLQQQKPSLNAEECALSRSFGTPAKWIIHCNARSWSQGAEASLARTVTNVLTLCENTKIATLAIPSIGSGNAGFPKDIAARTILSAIKGYFDAKQNTTLNLRTVLFVLYDNDSINIFKRELANLT